jgi:hypothetical protein
VVEHVSVWGLGFDIYAVVGKGDENSHENTF